MFLPHRPAREKQRSESAIMTVLSVNSTLPTLVGPFYVGIVEFTALDPDPRRHGCPPGLRSGEPCRDERSAPRLALAASRNWSNHVPSEPHSSAICAWARPSSETKPATTPTAPPNKGDG